MIVRLSLSLVALTGFAFPADGAPTRLSVLIVDGINNHDWPATTPVLKRILEQSGRFDVDVSTSPPRGAAPAEWDAWRPKFARYAVVISNFNGGDHGADVIQWPSAVRANFEAYVRHGGGFVSYHAANNAFPGWHAYEDMVGLLWRPNSFGPGVTFDARGKPVIIPAGTSNNPNHPRRLDFDVTVRDRTHPITRGLPADFTVQSEQLTYGQHGPEAVVRSGALTYLTYAWCEAVQEREPIDWIRRWGKGRVYVTMLGHTWRNEPSPDLANPWFRTLLLRGTEWAATGKVTIKVQR
ncbi:ThuA domain-containing protein [Sphingomonas sp. JC676]|uniref:ThuA domain-containing protein n=1 Tax=Sphingomonas sp. JC676 TaxID=2768065 RepID=UPI0016584155|nr:ThuA domain-containing protein [Sphingomonas sp. JC676]MBC9035062.1 ThuA domain-containing protein [Sphingomonas sp. JC676]